MPHKMMNPQIAYVLHDNRLSIEARMLYAYLCSFDDGVPPSTYQMIRQLGIGKTRFYRYRNELEAFGLIEVENNGDISARFAATKLGITHPTFLKYVKECDVRLHKDDLVQTHNPRGLTERHAAATDAARNLNHDQDAPDSPLRDR